MIISIDILLYRIEIGKYRIAGYENRYRIVTNHPFYTPSQQCSCCTELCSLTQAILAERQGPERRNPSQRFHKRQQKVLLYGTLLQQPAVSEGQL